MKPAQAGSRPLHEDRSISGQALVEFALLFVLFVFLVVAVVDIARIFHAEITITNAAREGARFATMTLNLRDGLTPYNSTDPNNETLLIRRAVVLEGQNSNITIDPLRVSAACFGGPCTAGVPLIVGVEYDFDFLTSFWANDHLTLRRQIEMVVP